MDAREGAASGAGAVSLLDAPARRVEGFGRAVGTTCPVHVARSVEHLGHLLDRAAEQRVALALRGTGNSYGDAAFASGGVVVDCSALRRVHAFDPETGVVDAEPGVTIRDLWRLGLPEGWWPAVVSGTQRPTLGGAAATNIHGKNNFRVGPVGDHILGFELRTPRGETLRCSRSENADVFHAAIAGLGMLGVFTRIRIRMKRVESGLLGVEAIATGDLAESFDAFEEHLPTADYLVGWLDAMPRGARRGRGILHAARYLEADADGRDALRLERQENPTTLLGVPKRWLWRAMRPMMNGPGVALVNTARCLAGRRHAGGAPERWTHTEYAFLLDSIPDWRLAYGGSGFIQYQPFVPAEHAREVMTRLLAMCREADMPPYLVVLKRHRPDAFLLGHGLDGYSLAMDLRVRPAEREALWQLCHRMSDCVLEAGGRFHPAKDALLRAADVRRALGDERLDAFRALRARLDPEGVLRTDLARRWLGEA